MRTNFIRMVVVCGAVIMAGIPAWADVTPVTAVKKQADGLVLTLKPGLLQMQVWAEDAIRVTYATGTELPALKSLAVVAKPAAARWELRETADAVFLETPALHVKVDRATGAVSFLDLQDKPLLAESPSGREFAPSQPFSPVPNSNPQPPSILPPDATLVRQSFVLGADEAIYGLGQHQQGVWNYHENGGRAVRLLQQNTEVGIPVILSSKGYVLFWDNPAVTEVSVGAPAGPGRGRGAAPGAGENIMRWSSEVGRAIDYYFVRGETPDDSMRGYRRLTGDAPMLPKWAWGFLHSKERYRSQAEMLEVATEFRKNNIPIDVLIQDWRYWPDNTWGSHQFDKTRYPDAAEMFKELHGLHFHALISVWPKFDLGTSNIEELEKAGAMYEPVIPYVYPPGRGKWYDPMSKAGRETYWNQLATELLPLGADGWWLDAPEPELSGKWGEYRYFKTAAGPGAEVFDAYPLMHSTGIYEGQRATTKDEKRVIILTRSAWAGQQRNSAITWSGDIGSTWQVFRNQIPAGLNFVASGIPYWNTDTGGFFNNAGTGNMLPTDSRYQEIFTRWFQFSAFCPMFRVHGTGQNSGTGIGKEIYRFPEEPRKNLLAMLNLRYRLLPYIYSTAWQVTSHGYTMMRPLVMDFAEDAAALNIPDQYLFGPAIMVNPVTTQGATTRSVYLPNKWEWYDFWTGKRQKGGVKIDAAAPMSVLPLYVRGGSIVPLGPLLEYTGEKAADPLELRVYRGADGAFTLYEDEGDSYRYEKGVCATIPMVWNEAAQTLTIGERKGAFPGMLQERTINVVFVGENHGNGAGLAEKPDQVVKYSGKAVSVKAGG